MLATGYPRFSDDIVLFNRIRSRYIMKRRGKRNGKGEISEREKNNREPLTLDRIFYAIINAKRPNGDMTKLR